MHCSTLDYVTLITALPHGSRTLVCSVSQRCLSTTDWCFPDVRLLRCRRAARSILPLRFSLISARPSDLHLRAGGAKHQNIQCFSGSSAKRNGVGLVGDAPGLVAMVMVGLYLVQLFHCARL